MDPKAWRKRAGWSLREAARLLGCSSASSVKRWEDGERDAPNSITLAYRQISEGKVTDEDMARVRRRYLRVSANEAA